MPHTTSNEVITPTLSPVSTIDVWDDPRRVTTFSTFHQPNGNGNSNNGIKAFSETTFSYQPKTNGHTSSPEPLEDGHQNSDEAVSINGNSSVGETTKPNLGLLKQRTSPKLGKFIRPVVTPPPRIDSKLQNGHSFSNGVSKDYKVKDLNGYTTIKENGDHGSHTQPQTDSELPSRNCRENPVSLTENGVDATSLVDINLGPFDKRFGFSVVGGSDEGFDPRIEHITQGSPADRADLEVGDEILEVNGRSLDNCTHTEVISHIHQCIRSRTICLRVKRKTSCKLALDLARNSNVQDAFVIAVEQQAKERLEKLSALKKIKPVDMTKLSQELNECNNSTAELNGVIESNPIYVTTVPEIHNATLERVRKDLDNNYTNHYTTSSIKSSHTNGHGHAALDQELELKQEILDREDETLSSPETPPRERLLVEADNNDIVNKFTQLCVSVETLLPNLPDKQNGSIYKQQPRLDQISRNSAFKQDLKTHREMAVDVPDSFVGVAKTAPKYPPHKTTDGQSTEIFILSSGDNSFNENSSNRLNSVSSKNALNSRIICDGSASAPRAGIAASDCDDLNLENATEDQLERIRKYQDDIRKRKIEEVRIAKENEFLRTSLRGSKKLQALEDNPPKRGVDNTVFEQDPDLIPLQEIPSDKLTTPELAKNFGASELLQSLYRLSASLQGNGHKDSDLMLVEGLIRNTDFQNILAIHNKVQEVCCFKCPPTPLSNEAQDITQEVLNVMQECPSLEASELVDILSRYEFEGLMYAHDKIATRQSFTSVTTDEQLLDRASHYTEDSVKIVRIEKTNEPLGATVKNEGEAVVIGRVLKGGAAEKSGLLHEGDEILEVNGVEMRRKNVNNVCDILATMTGTLTFLIIPAQQELLKKSQMEAVVHVKAHFNYDASDDMYIPCKELGISFQKGDILHVMSQEDPHWWQAYREGEEEQPLAGLVPSKSFQEQRELMQNQNTVGDTKEKAKKSGKFLCAKKYYKKKKKKLYNANLTEDTDTEPILSYEEVALYYPRANRKRPTVLIGPPNIGRHELRQRLMEDTERFAAAVPHTSRIKRDSEMDGADYHFISRSQFEADIVSGRFVEHGEYEKNYYGTSLDAIRTVVNSEKICVLNLHPQSLKILRNSDLKPYVVFVAPPCLEKLRVNRIKAGDNPKEDELIDIIEKAREMEESYGHYFDMVIINSDVDKAFHELLKEINTLEREPQWVPKMWLEG